MVELTQILIALGVILISMTLHEMAHGWVAYALGDMTPKAQGRLTPNPLKHIDPVMSLALPLLLAISGGPIFGGAKPVQINTLKLKGGEYGFALVAIAGPLTNLVLAYLSFVLWYVINPSGDIINQIFAAFVQINLGFFIFNLIPIPPLDGSRVLYALAPEFIKRFMAKIEQMGMFLVLILVILFQPVLSSFMYTAMRFFIDLFSKLVV